MVNMCLSPVGVLLLALHLLSSQVVQAQNATEAPGIATMSSYNITPTATALVNVTARENNGCGRMDARALLLLPLALGASLLHGWSQ